MRASSEQPKFIFHAFIQKKKFENVNKRLKICAKLLTWCTLVLLCTKLSISQTHFSLSSFIQYVFWTHTMLNHLCAYLLDKKVNFHHPFWTGHIFSVLLKIFGSMMIWMQWIYFLQVNIQLQLHFSIRCTFFFFSFFFSGASFLSSISILNCVFLLIEIFWFVLRERFHSSLMLLYIERATHINVFVFWPLVTEYVER